MRHVAAEPDEPGQRFVAVGVVRRQGDGALGPGERAVAFLVSDRAASIHGSEYAIDGGTVPAV